MAPYTTLSWVTPWKGGPSAQAALFDLATYPILNYTGLPAGQWTFYFGVDLAPNGVLYMDALFYDSVEVTVTP